MVVVGLDLVDIEDAIDGDSRGLRFDGLVTEVLKECITTDQYFEALNRNSFNLCFPRVKQSDDKGYHLTDQLRTVMKRYIRVSDKYLGLLSLLIKSREFHMTYSTLHPSSYPLSIVDLPKSREGKPFIPAPTNKPSAFEFSVSHQYPFLGIARVRGIRVGLDIVTFDELNHRLYSSEEEYVAVFRSSFAETEWQWISRSRAILFEFAVRWAVKEAYTKSVGMGMSLAFHSFVVTLDKVDNMWDYISMNADPENGIILRGTICHRERTSNERCSFFFHLIKRGKKLRGCACVCIPDDDGHDALSVNTNWVFPQNLFSWHQAEPTSS